MQNNLIHFFDNIDIIYYINIDWATERRNNMENMLSQINIPYTRINAVDGENISDDALYDNFIFEDDNNRLKKKEYACLLSHLNTLLTFYKSEYEHALVLEDDMTLEYSIYWDKKIKKIMDDAPEDWDIIMLNYCIRNKLPDKLYTLNKSVYMNINNDYASAGAYIINKRGVKKLLNEIYFNNRFILKKDYIYYADIYIYNLLNTYVYLYPYFIYKTNNDSIITNNSNIDFQNDSKRKLFDNSWNKLLPISNT